MLRYSDSLSSTFISDSFTREEDKYEEYIETVHELNVNSVILEYHSDHKDPIVNKSRKVMTQQLIRTTNSRTKWIITNFTGKFNYCCLARVKLKVLDKSNKKSKVHARKLPQMCGIGIEQAKKSIMASTQNFIRGLTIPLTKQFRTRQAMFRFRWFRGETYTNTMI